MYSERRENHEECGDNRLRKYTRRVARGWVWFCHNCSATGFVTDEVTSPSETVRNATLATYCNPSMAERVVEQVRLPLDCKQSVIPSEGHAWLAKYYIREEEIEKYGIGYSQYFKRLILPVYSPNRGLVYWQGRSLKPPYTTENPKYLNIRQSGAKNVFFRILCPVTKSPDTLVVVEDILSAIRVGRTHNSLALLGSYFPIELRDEFKKYEIIKLFLDHDKWKESVKAGRKFNQLTGKKFIILDNVKDPKELLPRELEEFICQ